MTFIAGYMSQVPREVGINSRAGTDHTYGMENDLLYI